MLDWSAIVKLKERLLIPAVCLDNVLAQFKKEDARNVFITRFQTDLDTVTPRCYIRYTH